MTQFFLSVHREKKLSHFDLKSWVTGGIKIRPNFFRSKWLNFFAQCTEGKNWVILILKVESLAELKFDSTFQVKMTQFICQCNDWKKWSHFDLKSWVIGGTKIWPNFLSQTDSIFSLGAPRERIESFWP